MVKMATCKSSNCDDFLKNLMEDLEEKEVTDAHDDPELELIHSSLAPDSAWKDQPVTPALKMANLLRSGKLSDITVVLSDVLLPPLKLHRLILAASSHVFETMLYGSLPEGETLILKEDPPEAFVWIVHYLYLGDTKFASVLLAVEVYQLAHKYEMGDVITISTKFLLTADAIFVPMIYDMSRLLDNELLKSYCYKSMQCSARTVLGSRYIGWLSVRSFEALMKIPFTLASEVDLYKAIVKWGKFRIEAKKNEETTEEVILPEALQIRHEIVELIKMVRFQTLTTDEFVTNVMPDDVLTMKECRDILMTIKAVKGATTPAGFTSSSLHRTCFPSHLLRTCTLRPSAVAESRHLSPFTLHQGAAEHIILISHLQVSETIHLSAVERPFWLPVETNYRLRLLLQQVDSPHLDQDRQTIQCTWRARSSALHHPVQLIPHRLYTILLLAEQRHLPTVVDSIPFSAVEDGVTFQGYMDNSMIQLRFWHFH